MLRLMYNWEPACCYFRQTPPKYLTRETTQTNQDWIWGVYALRHAGHNELFTIDFFFNYHLKVKIFCFS